MTGPQYRAIREALGMTQVELAAALGVDTMTVSRREREASPIDQEAEMAITGLAKERRVKTSR